MPDEDEDAIVGVRGVCQLLATVIANTPLTLQNAVAYRAQLDECMVRPSYATRFPCRCCPCPNLEASLHRLSLAVSRAAHCRASASVLCGCGHWCRAAAEPCPRRGAVSLVKNEPHYFFFPRFLSTDPLCLGLFPAVPLCGVRSLTAGCCSRAQLLRPRATFDQSCSMQPCCASCLIADQNCHPRYAHPTPQLALSLLSFCALALPQTLCPA